MSKPYTITFENLPEGALVLRIRPGDTPHLCAHTSRSWEETAKAYAETLGAIKNLRASHHDLHVELGSQTRKAAGLEKQVEVLARRANRLQNEKNQLRDELAQLHKDTNPYRAKFKFVSPTPETTTAADVAEAVVEMMTRPISEHITSGPTIQAQARLGRVLDSWMQGKVGP